MKSRRRQLGSLWLIATSLAAAWLGMMLVHELGHVLFAWFTGGSVLAVSVPLVGFSYTALERNPSPIIVAWGGFIVGALAPLGMWLITRLANWRLEPGMRFFAAFCMWTNGAYMASALSRPVGDVDDILIHGGARWPLMVGGPLLLAGGFAVLGREGVRGLLDRAKHPTRAAMVTTGALLVASVAAALGVSSLGSTG